MAAKGGRKKGVSLSCHLSKRGEKDYGRIYRIIN